MMLITKILVGGFSLPLWKMMEWVTVGIMTFPIYGKIKFMFQTTNQYCLSRPFKRFPIEGFHMPALPAWLDQVLTNLEKVFTSTSRKFAHFPSKSPIKSTDFSPKFQDLWRCTIKIPLNNIPWNFANFIEFSLKCHQFPLKKLVKLLPIQPRLNRADPRASHRKALRRRCWSASGVARRHRAGGVFHEILRFPTEI